MGSGTSFQNLVDLALSQKSKEEREKDFWDLQSLRLDQMLKDLRDLYTQDDE